MRCGVGVLANKISSPSAQRVKKIVNSPEGTTLVRGKLVWVWWVSKSMRPQGTIVEVGMELSCKLGRPLRGIGSIESSTHTQEDCVERDISTFEVVCTVVCVVAVRLLTGHQASYLCNI
eukprot:1140139-Pelagomonas_calceolata.AAC.1